MHRFLKQYGDTEGPLGFPMRDADAKALDRLLKEHPGAEHVRASVTKATTEISDGERADVAWIQTEAIDLQREIVLAAGFRDDLFAANPIVTLNHSYCRPPIGKSLWRKRVKEGERRGVKAKTIYPARPDEWPADQEWPSDSAWSLVKSGLMNGKSIGFLSLKAHSPTAEEIRRSAALALVDRIIDEWVLLEYACCWAPVNPEAVNEDVSKCCKSLGLQARSQESAVRGQEVIPFTTLEQYESALSQAVAQLDTKRYIERLVNDAIDKHRGRI